VGLTAREAQILRCLSDGAMSQKDVARRLGVTRNTVKTHLKSAYLKLGAHSRSEAVQLARRCGLLAPTLQIVPTSEGRDGARPTLMPRSAMDESARRSA
jgi:DNA-binding CsgD family transcriptional regulator